MKRDKQIKQQLNNEGFSLLEVLVAIVILCIVSIPLLHAFVTAAKTNGEAKITLRATSVAEDLMENFKYRSIDELYDIYAGKSLNSVTEDTATGIHEFIIADQSQFSQTLPDGYYVKMKLDPTLYPNANALNLSDFSTVSAADSAVYSMPLSYDNNVYLEYEERSKEYNETNSALFPEKKDAAFFKDNLNRIITVSISKNGTTKNSLDEEVELVKVSLVIKYELKNYSNILPANDTLYESKTIEVFNNSSSKTKLNGIFILYNPRYVAAKNVKGDSIIVNNPDNVATNLYVVAQNDAADAEYARQYLNAANGLQLVIKENASTSGFPASTEGALTLRTNLCEDAPYTGLSGETSDVKCNLIYQNLTGSLKTSNPLDAQKIIHTGDVTGKALDSSQTSNRIYKVTTTVFNAKGEPLLELDGTRLNAN